MTDKPHFIDGVYNYCDRWCERCPLTSRCHLFVIEKHIQAEKKTRPIDAGTFWDAMNDLFDEQAPEAFNAFDEFGIEFPDDDEADQDMASRMEARHEAAHEHPLARKSREYASRAKRWLERHAAMLLSNSTPEASDLGEGEANAEQGREPTVINLNDAIKVVHWYECQIGIKLMRALTQDPDAEEQFDEDPIQNDANGSAKVSLLGIRRSLAAWHFIRQHMPGQSDELLDFMLTLNRIRRGIQHRFPHAQAFVRPGFDRPED